MASRQRSRSRSPVQERHRVTYEQMEALVDYLETHRELATGYLSTTAGRYKANQSWQTAATLLNGIGRGATKDAKGWSAYWSNYKNKLKAKLRQIRTATSGTGGGRPRTSHLTDLDERVLRLLGPTFGSAISGVRVDPFLELPEAEAVHETARQDSEEYVVELDNIFSGDLSLPIEFSSNDQTAETLVSQSILSPDSPPAPIIQWLTSSSIRRVASPATSVTPLPSTSLAQVAPLRATSSARVAQPLATSSPRVTPTPSTSSARVRPPPAGSSARVTPTTSTSSARVAAPPAASSEPVAPPPAPSSVAPPPRPRSRRRRCVPLQTALDAARNAVTQIERDRLEADRRALQNASDSAAALQRVATAIEHQSVHAAGLTAAVRALADAQAEQATAVQSLAHAQTAQATAMQALADAATAALQYLGNISARSP